jgi:mannitol/fructose-specific phosphotransferase system IIA component (Ntr-type)
MIHIEDTLRPEHVLLGLSASSLEAATEALLAPLHDDERVLDWPAFHEALRKHPPCQVWDNAPYGIYVPHARTDAVSGMVLTAARLAADTVFPECMKPVRYVFCLGVPQAMAADYLRIAGLLMRIFTDESTEETLRTAQNGETFLSALENLEVKI